MQKRFLLAGLMLLTGGFALSEPSSHVRYLINEPATLLDLGLFQLKYDLADFAQGSTTSTSYDFQANRILIEVQEHAGRATASEAKARCAELLNGLRARLGVLNGKPILKDGSALVGYFSHAGYVTDKEPAQLARHLDTITELHVITSVNGGGSVECQAPLVSTTVLYSK